MCNKKSFKKESSDIAAGGQTPKPISTSIMREWQNENTDTSLIACGTLPECRENCPFSPISVFNDMVERVAQRIALQ